MVHKLRLLGVLSALLLAAAVASCGPTNPKAGTPNTTGTATSSSTTRPTDPGWTPPATGGTFNPPRTSPAPTTGAETEQPTDHQYGPCEQHKDWKNYNRHVIIGTEGDDVINGTAGDDEICGMGGNDTISGGGGNDLIWGGPGDDVIHGSPGVDTLEGNDGNDLIYGGNTSLRGEYDTIYGDTHDLYGRYADTGDDVLIGGTLSLGELMWGGPGNDILMPTAIRTLSNFLNGGDGKDVLIALNFSTGPNTDHVDPDGKPDTTVTAKLTNKCKVKRQLSYDPNANQAAGSVDCDIPWPSRFTKLKRLLPIAGSIDTKGHLSLDMTLYQGLAKLSVDSWHNMVAWQATLVDDACICDPVTEIPPEDPREPYDVP